MRYLLQSLCRRFWHPNDSRHRNQANLRVEHLEARNLLAITTTTIVLDSSDGTNLFDPTAPEEVSTEVEDDSDSVEVTNGGPAQGAPTANADFYSTDEQTALNVAAPGLLGNDTDPNPGDVLTVTGFDATSSAGATVSVAADGSFTYDPTVSSFLNSLAAGETFDDTFSYGIDDGNGGTDVGTVTVTVTGVNDLPTANDDLASTDEDTATAVNVLGNDTDPDTSDVLTVSSIGGTPIGSVTNNGTNVTYDPNGQFEYLAVGETTTDSFTYVADDGNGGSDTATVTVTITGVNDPPTADDDSATTDEDTAIAIDVLNGDTDPDTSDTLTIIGIGGTPTGNVTNNGTDVTYDPNGQFEFLDDGETAIDTFTYTISDGNGGTDTAIVTVTITGINDPPDAVDDNYSTDENTRLFVPGPGFLSNDSDPEGTSITLTSINASGTTGTVITHLAEAGSVAIDHTQTTVTLSNTYVNPVVIAQPAEFNGGDPVVVRLSGISGNQFTIQLQEPSNFAPGTHTTETVHYIVVEAGSWVLPDGTLLEAGTFATNSNTNSFATVNFATSFGSTPVVMSQVQTLNDTTFVSTRQQNLSAGSFQVALEDEDAAGNNHGTETIGWLAIEPGTGDIDGRLFEAGTTPDSVTHNLYNIGFSAGFTSAPNFIASLATFDGGDASHLRFDNLGAGSVDVFVEEDTTVDSETDHTTERVTWLAIEGDGALLVDGGFIYDPGAAFDYLAEGETATDTFTYTIVDESGLTSTATVTVTITGVNDPPTANDDVATTDEDTSINIDVLSNDTDPDTTDTLTVASVSGGSGAVTNNGTDISYDPAGAFDYLGEGETATDTFTYTLSDGNGGTSTATVTVTVTGVNDPPQAIDDSYSTDEDTPISINPDGVLANDTDPDGIGAVPTATLNYDAESDDGLNPLWEELNNTAGADLQLSGLTFGAVASSLPGITQAYTFSGAGGGDYGADPDSLQDLLGQATTQSSASWEFWLRPAAGGDLDMLFESGGAGDGVSIVYDGTNNEIIFTIDNQSVQRQISGGSAQLDSTEFHQVVAVYERDFSGSNDIIRLFVDGTLVADSSGSPTTGLNDWDGGDVANLGQSTSSHAEGTPGGTTDFEGEIAKFRFYNSALSTPEIQGAYDEVAVGPALTVTEINGSGSLIGTSTLGAAVVMNADGSFSYDPTVSATLQALASGDSVVDTFTYTVEDANGATSTATVSVTVSGLNELTEIGEAGSVTFTQSDSNTWFTVNLNNSYTNAVVVMGPVSIEGGNPSTVRVRNVNSTSFEFQLDEWDYLDGGHVEEIVHYIVLEAGVHTLEDGTLVEAGNLSVDENFTTQSLSAGFAAAPVVVSQVTTTNETSAVTTRQQSVGTGSFDVRLQEEENADGTHAAETVSFIAFGAGTGSTAGLTFEATTVADVTHNYTTVNFGASFSSAPVFVSDMQTFAGTDPAVLRYDNLGAGSVEVKVEEEESSDTETNHANEVVGYVAFDAGIIEGTTALVASTTATTSTEPVPELSETDLGAIFEEAIDRWETSGLSVNELANVELRVADLPGNLLGTASETTVTLDVNAASHGWFIDVTPDDDSEFAILVSDTERQASNDSAAAGQMDLLTVVMHELGHTAGYDDLLASSSSDNLMFHELPLSTRRFPNPNEIDNFFAMLGEESTSDAADREDDLYDDWQWE